MDVYLTLKEDPLYEKPELLYFCLIGLFSTLYLLIAGRKIRSIQAIFLLQWLLLSGKVVIAGLNGRNWNNDGRINWAIDFRGYDEFIGKLVSILVVFFSLATHLNVLSKYRQIGGSKVVKVPRGLIILLVLIQILLMAATIFFHLRYFNILSNLPDLTSIFVFTFYGFHLTAQFICCILCLINVSKTGGRSKDTYCHVLG